jgi:hypothetical protein
MFVRRDPSPKLFAGLLLGNRIDSCYGARQETGTADSNRHHPGTGNRIGNRQIAPAFPATPSPSGFKPDVCSMSNRKRNDDAVHGGAKPMSAAEMAALLESGGLKLLSRAEVFKIIPTLSVAGFWAWQKEHHFPAAIELGPAGGRNTRVAWWAHEVLQADRTGRAQLSRACRCRWQAVADSAWPAAQAAAAGRGCVCLGSA